jgi:CheY-like chemotaxis protein
MLKILIVDDNAEIRRLIASIVQPFADEIRECADGSAALAVYRAQQPDLILMDIEMPTTDGIQATRIICAAEPGARIAMLTNYDDVQLCQSALKAGAFAYLVKDDLTTLVRLLESMTERN